MIIITVIVIIIIMYMYQGCALRKIEGSPEL